MVSSPFDRFIKCTLVGTWIDAVNPCPLYFVVPTRSEATVFGRFDANVRIFNQATREFLCSWAIDALITASVTYVPAVGDVPIGFEFATIIARPLNQEIGPKKANKKKEDADQVFVRRLSF